MNISTSISSLAFITLIAFLGSICYNCSASLTVKDGDPHKPRHKHFFDIQDFFENDKFLDDDDELEQTTSVKPPGNKPSGDKDLPSNNVKKDDKHANSQGQEMKIIKERKKEEETDNESMLDDLKTTVEKDSKFLSDKTTTPEDEGEDSNEMTTTITSSLSSTSKRPRKTGLDVESIRTSSSTTISEDRSTTISSSSSDFNIETPTTNAQIFTTISTTTNPLKITTTVPIGYEVNKNSSLIPSIGSASRISCSSTIPPNGTTSSSSFSSPDMKKSTNKSQILTTTSASINTTVSIVPTSSAVQLKEKISSSSKLTPLSTSSVTEKNNKRNKRMRKKRRRRVTSRPEPESKAISIDQTMKMKDEGKTAIRNETWSIIKESRIRSNQTSTPRQEGLLPLTLTTEDKSQLLVKRKGKFLSDDTQKAAAFTRPEDLQEIKGQKRRKRSLKYDAEDNAETTTRPETTGSVETTSEAVGKLQLAENQYREMDKTADAKEVKLESGNSEEDSSSAESSDFKLEASEPQEQEKITSTSSDSSLTTTAKVCRETKKNFTEISEDKETSTSLGNTGSDETATEKVVKLEAGNPDKESDKTDGGEEVRLESGNTEKHSNSAESSDVKLEASEPEEATTSASISSSFVKRTVKPGIETKIFHKNKTRFTEVTEDVKTSTRPRTVKSGDDGEIKLISESSLEEDDNVKLRSLESKEIMKNVTQDGKKSETQEDKIRREQSERDKKKDEEYEKKMKEVRLKAINEAKKQCKKPIQGLKAGSSSGPNSGSARGSSDANMSGTKNKEKDSKLQSPNPEDDNEKLESSEPEDETKKNTTQDSKKCEIEEDKIRREQADKDKKKDEEYEKKMKEVRQNAINQAKKQCKKPMHESNIGSTDAKHDSSKEANGKEEPFQVKLESSSPEDEDEVKLEPENPAVKKLSEAKTPPMTMQDKIEWEKWKKEMKEEKRKKDEGADNAMQASPDLPDNDDDDKNNGKNNRAPKASSRDGKSNETLISTPKSSSATTEKPSGDKSMEAGSPDDDKIKSGGKKVQTKILVLDEVKFKPEDGEPDEKSDGKDKETSSFSSTSNEKPAGDNSLQASASGDEETTTSSSNGPSSLLTTLSTTTVDPETSKSRETSETTGTPGSDDTSTEKEVKLEAGNPDEGTTTSTSSDSSLSTTPEVCHKKKKKSTETSTTPGSTGSDETTTEKEVELEAENLDE